MMPDGTYVREKGGEGTSSQEALYRYFSNIRVSVEEHQAEEAVEDNSVLPGSALRMSSESREILDSTPKKVAEPLYKRLQKLFKHNK